MRAAGKPAGYDSLRDDLARCTFPPASRLRQRPVLLRVPGRGDGKVALCE